MDLKNAEIEEGYGMDVVVSRQVGTLVWVLPVNFFILYCYFLGIIACECSVFSSLISIVLFPVSGDRTCHSL